MAQMFNISLVNIAFFEVAGREGWDVVYCVEKDEKTMRDREAIHEEVYQLLKKKGVI